VLLFLVLLFLPAAACRPRAPAAIGEGEVPTKRAEVPRITPAELKARLDTREKIVIVDARPLRAYNVRHIADAISVPLQEVEERADELPRNHTIVFYCT